MTVRSRSGVRSRSPWRSVPSGETLLLDTMTAPAVAFSTRKLRTAYSGQCLRVRRSSDNAEQDIGFVANKLDTASLLTFVGAGDGFVVTWYDQSGNARNATQATAGKQLYIAQSGATTAWGAQGDVAILNPGENRFLSYTLAALIPQPYTSLLAAQLKVMANGVLWNVGGPYWQLNDGGTVTKWFDATGTHPQTTATLAARVFVASLATGDKRARHSGGTTSTAGTAPTNISTTGHLIGTYVDGYASPQNAGIHSCVVWAGATADIDTPYLAAAAWL